MESGLGAFSVDILLSQERELTQKRGNNFTFGEAFFHPQYNLISSRLTIYLQPCVASTRCSVQTKLLPMHIKYRQT